MIHFPVQRRHLKKVNIGLPTKKSYTGNRRCTFAQLPLLAMCSMIINNRCAAVQLHQCTRGQHHSISCGQVIRTHNPTTDRSTATAHVVFIIRYALHTRYGVTFGQALIFGRYNKRYQRLCRLIMRGTFTITSVRGMWYDYWQEVLRIRTCRE